MQAEAGNGDVGATIEQLSHALVKYEAVEAAGVESPGVPPAGPAITKTALVPFEEQPDRTRDILGADEVLEHLFPRKVTEDGEHTISMQMAESLDVIALQEQLELRLNLRSARAAGVCVQREDLYAQCLDELIRQITIECPERGLLLARIRDEMNMTISGYRALIDTSASLAMRKVIQRSIQHEINKELNELEYEVQIQQKRVHALDAKLNKTRKIIEDKQKLQEAQHDEEIRFIKKGNQQLNNELKRLTQAQQSG